jgi:hypothetical protein
MCVCVCVCVYLDEAQLRFLQVVYLVAELGDVLGGGCLCVCVCVCECECMYVLCVCVCVCVCTCKVSSCVLTS